MMYCVTVVIIVALICATIITLNIIHQRVFKFNKLLTQLEDAKHRIRELEIERDHEVSQQNKELTVLHDKLSRLMDKQSELAKKLEKGGKE